MKKGICYVIGAGENHGLDFIPQPEDYLIAADGGFAYLLEQGFQPDLLIGDFDSLCHQPEKVRIIALPCEKNETDTFAAIEAGISQGYDTFHIYCGTGGRKEHTLANIQLLAYLSQNGMKGFLFGKDDVITAITDSTLHLGAHHVGYVSVFSHSDKSSGVTLTGLKYALDHADVTNHFPVGISNEFTGVQSTITVEKGTLLIVLPRTDKNFVL